METKRKLYIAAAVLIVLVVALGLLTACTSESLVAYEAPVVGTAPASYTLTVQASKGEAATSRALNLDSSGALNASWTKDDEVKVYNASGTEVGILKAASSGVETMLEGTLTTLPANGDVLTLKFLSPSYANQGGTLEYIAANCDYATASVTVLSIDGTDVTTTGAVFENQQSIVKFTLQDFTSAAISATDMTIVADGNTYSIKTTSATSEFFVALPSFSNKTISMAATNGTDNYIFDRENTTIESGKYYTLTMQMDKLVGNLVNLSTLEGNYTAQSGDILTGTIDNTIKISIEEGASITLYNASISAGEDTNAATNWGGITCLGNATITLVGENVVKGNRYFSGIQAGPEETTLTITGTGSLRATGGLYAAGIGCGSSGDGGSCGNITINGGIIEATGSTNAAGIGSGWGWSCGDITITGGSIKATGGLYAAGIGSGYYGSCGDISIGSTASGSAKGGGNNLCDIGPGIEGTCGNVIVESNNFSGNYHLMLDLSKLNGNYEAQNGDILTGTIDNTIKISIEEGASITLYNVSINAGGADSSNTSWAGITCLGNATITLAGTNVVNGCNDGFPGIQAGGKNTTLTITGTGSLRATGGDGAAGIGSGSGSPMSSQCGNIIINGNYIEAVGGAYAAGIGSGQNGECGDITIGSAVLGSATRGTGNQYDIGPGSGSTCGTVIVESNIFSGSYPGQPVVTLPTCTFTLKFYESYTESGNAVTSFPVGGYNANASTIEVTVNGAVYTSTGTYNNNDTVTINLPTGTDMTLTITAPNAEYWNQSISGGSLPKANFSATLTNVTITEGSENNLGTVNLVRQQQP